MDKKIVLISGFVALVAIGTLLEGGIISFALFVCCALMIAQMDSELKNWVLTKVGKPDFKVDTIERSISIKVSAALFVIAAVLTPSSEVSVEELAEAAQATTDSKSKQDIWLKGVMPAPKVSGSMKDRKVDSDFAEHIKEQGQWLWSGLNDLRYNSNFHKVGFGGNGASYAWEQRRRAIDNLWSSYISKFPHAGNTEYIPIGIALDNLRTVGMDWRRTKGEDTQFTLATTPNIVDAFD